MWVSHVQLVKEISHIINTRIQAKNILGLSKRIRSVSSTNQNLTSVTLASSSCMNLRLVLVWIKQKVWVRHSHDITVPDLRWKHLALKTVIQGLVRTHIIETASSLLSRLPIHSTHSFNLLPLEFSRLIHHLLVLLLNFLMKPLPNLQLFLFSLLILSLQLVYTWYLLA